MSLPVAFSFPPCIGPGRNGKHAQCIPERAPEVSDQTPNDLGARSLSRLINSGEPWSVGDSGALAQATPQ
jgi:hypothetical protein